MSPRITIVLLCLGVILGIASAKPQYQQQRKPIRPISRPHHNPNYPQVQGRNMIFGPFIENEEAVKFEFEIPLDHRIFGVADLQDPCACVNVLAGNTPDRVAH